LEGVAFYHIYNQQFDKSAAVDYDSLTHGAMLGPALFLVSYAHIAQALFVAVYSKCDVPNFTDYSAKFQSVTQLKPYLYSECC